MKCILTIGIVCCIILYTSAQLPEGRRRFSVPSLSDILTSPDVPNTGVVDLSPSSGVFEDLQGGFGGLNDAFVSPVGETGSGGGTVNEPTSGLDGFGTSSDSKISANGGTGTETAGHEHAHGPEVHNKAAANVGHNTITDALGNVPPPPSGVHVDLPGEHGNPHEFPVIHHGKDPIHVSTDPFAPTVHSSSNDFHPNTLAAKNDDLQVSDHSIPVPMESSHGPQVVTHGPANIDHSQNPFHATNVHNIAGRPIAKGGSFEDLSLLQSGDGFIDLGGQQPTDGLLNLPHDSSITNANHASDNLHSMHNNIDNSASNTDWLISQNDGFLTPLNERHNDPNQRGTKANVHIDMPGEHSNPVSGEPVIHREIQHAQHPVAQNENIHDNMLAEHGLSVNSPPKTNENIVSVSETLGNNNKHIDLSGIHIDAPGVHGNMLNEPALHLPPGATVQDAIAAGIIPDPSLPAVTETVKPPGTSDIISSTGNVHDLPGKHGNTLDGHAVVHGDGNVGLGKEIKHAEIGLNVDSVHVDLPGQHNNPIDGTPVIHRGQQQIGDGGFGNVPSSGSSIFGPHSIGNVHVDLPGQHGNIGEHPVIHRDTSHFGPQAAVPTSNVHVDLPGQHGNLGERPVIHRDATHIGLQVDVPMGNVHVDLPGQHGNVGEHPVIHRDASHIEPQVGVPTGNVHIDLPGQHGNVGGHPIIHRDATHIGPENGLPNSDIHVDLPGQHGNIGEHPVIHRDASHTGPQVGVPTGNVHVDLPGQHGNVGEHPVIHRHASHIDPQVGVPTGNVHIDLPGQHGNVGGHPVIHRDATHIGPQVSVPMGNVHVDLLGHPGNVGGQPIIHRDATQLGPVNGLPNSDIHVDLPGQHGNLGEHPVIHRDATHIGPQVGVPTGNVHVGLPGQHDKVGGQSVIHRDATHIGPQIVDEAIGNIHVDLPGQHGNPLDRHPVIHREATHIGPHDDITFGNSHVDLPGQHGIPSNGIPTVHRDTMHKGPKVGIPIGDVHPTVFGPKGINKGFVPVVPTGVLPGTKNIPVPKRVFKNHETIDKPNTLHIPGSRKGNKNSINEYDRTNFGIVDGDSVLLKKGRRPGGRKRKGRKWRKPSTPTPVPKKTDGGSGIKIIKTSPPNPLAVLGNALKSVLTAGSSRGGGLLGSLIRSAVRAQQGPPMLPPPGIVIMPVRRPLYGRIMIGK